MDGKSADETSQFNNEDAARLEEAKDSISINIVSVHTEPRQQEDVKKTAEVSVSGDEVHSEKVLLSGGGRRQQDRNFRVSNAQIQRVVDDLVSASEN